MKKLRTCLICPNCGSKKFQRMQDTDVKARCLFCNGIMVI